MIGLSGAPVLETERLILRAPAASDWPHWRAFAETERTRYIGGPYDVAAAWRGFAHIVGHWVLRGYGNFVIQEKGVDAPLGMAGPWHPADWPEREIGWMLWNPAAEGRGFACEAAIRARAHAYADLGWDGAVSYIDKANVRSIRLAERLGATPDPDAAEPALFDEPGLVYRHPSPEALA